MATDSLRAHIVAVLQDKCFLGPTTLEQIADAVIRELQLELCCNNGHGIISGFIPDLPDDDVL